VRLASALDGQRERTEHEVFVAPIVLLVVLGSSVPPESGCYQNFLLPPGATRKFWKHPASKKSYQGSRFATRPSRLSRWFIRQADMIARSVGPGETTDHTRKRSIALHSVEQHSFPLQFA
jgi:hypothetical protein